MSVILTERAAEHVKNFLKDNEDAQGMRLGVRPTGCSGYMYVVETAKSVDPADTVVETLGVQLVIDEDSMKFLQGTTVDFGREGLNTGFRFDNPNVEETCGCGESFSLAEKLPVIESN